MKAINYRSFEEIDQQLKILWLQKEIAHENIKLGLKKTKNNLYPKNLLAGINNLGGTSAFIQSMLITILTDKILKKLKKRKAIH
jgi:hypothetical protein